jgi:hypothetical protein
MHSFRRLFLVLTLAAPAALLAQSTAPPSSSEPQAPSSTSASSTSSEAQPATPESGQITVAARIKQRREQRRVAAIRDTYDHLYEAFVDMGYLRFSPGPSLQRTTFYGWDTGFTRYRSERFGITFDARGYEGIAYTGFVPGVTNATNTRPKISMYDLMVGPSYRFYITPKTSISGRVLGGLAIGNFTGDTNGFGSLCTSAGVCALWPDGYTYAAGGSIVGQYNPTPHMSLRLSGEDLATGFGSTTENSFGFTAGWVYRFGKL